MEQVKILVVEDDADISNMLLDLLGQNGWEAVPAYSGTEALMVLERGGFSLVMLDLMLPGKSGQEVLAEMRAGAARHLPVIAVSALGAVTSKVEVLGLGANDYVTKPFDNDELVARIQVQLRAAAEHPAPADGLLRHGALSLDPQGLSAAVGETPLPLTKRELLILRLLLETPKKVFTKGNIYESVWGEQSWGDDNTVNVHISNIRSKIGKIDADTEYIQTVWGIGFKMAEVKS